MTKEREHPRRRTLKAGKIVFNKRCSTLSCSVRNMSDRGACVELVSSVGIPDSFELILDIDGLRRACNVVWRSKDRIGVAFR